MHRCSPESKVRGDNSGGPHASMGVEKDLFQVQTGREDMSSTGGKNGCFGEGLDCCFQRDVFGGSGRRACLEVTGDSKGASGPMGESPVEWQKDKRGTGPAVEVRGGLGRTHLSGPSLLRVGGRMGVDSPLGLLVGDDRAAATVPLEWFKPMSAWISGTDEAFQAEATRYSSIPSPLVSQGVRGFSSSISCRKRAANGFRRRGCGSATEMVGVDADISPLNMVLADGSVEAASSGEEMVLVLVGETSLDESNPLRQPVVGAESDGEWKSSCLAQFSDFMGIPTTGCEEEILTMLKKWIMRKDQKNQRFGAKRIKVESSKFVRELKRLECSINFKSLRHGRALFRESGGSVSKGK